MRFCLFVYENFLFTLKTCSNFNRKWIIGLGLYIELQWPSTAGSHGCFTQTNNTGICNYLLFIYAGCSSLQCPRDTLHTKVKLDQHNTVCFLSWVGIWRRHCAVFAAHLLVLTFSSLKISPEQWDFSQDKNLKVPSSLFYIYPFFVSFMWSLNKINFAFQVEKHLWFVGKALPPAMVFQSLCWNYILFVKFIYMTYRCSIQTQLILL